MVIKAMIRFMATKAMTPFAEAKTMVELEPIGFMVIEALIDVPMVLTSLDVNHNLSA